jgi:hypothetical protein
LPNTITTGEIARLADAWEKRWNRPTTAFGSSSISETVSCLISQHRLEVTRISEKIVQQRLMQPKRGEASMQIISSSLLIKVLTGLEYSVVSPDAFGK